MQTFVVRLHEDTGADTTRLCGVIEQVTTGLRVTFRSDLELVAALKAALESDPPDPPDPPEPPEPPDPPSGASVDGGDRVP